MSPVAHRRFKKYDESGAYHWDECDSRSRSFNPPLVARYKLATEQVKNGWEVLDIGCGDGYLISLLRERSKSVIGIEFEPTALSLASQNLGSTSNCHVVRATCYSLPISTRSVDAVLMTDVIEHLEHPDRALAEVARVLREDGRMILTTPKWRPDRMWDPRHVREYRPGELRECLQPFFEGIELNYFWPIAWSRLYSTRLGWRAIRYYARYFPNPFMRAGSRAQEFGQILAVCTSPKRDCRADRDGPGRHAQHSVR